jgi:hypothetical protein
MLQNSVFHFCEPRIRFSINGKPEDLFAVLFYTEIEGAGIYNYSRNRSSELLVFLFLHLLWLSHSDISKLNIPHP